MSIAEEKQKPFIKDLVVLYELDLTNIGGTSVLRFSTTPVKNAGGVLIDPVFGGNTYITVDIQVTGFEYNGRGQFPRPTLKISNVNKILFSFMLQFEDLLGAKFTRIRTLRKHLDDGSDPDVNAVFPKDIYYVEQKTKHNKLEIEFVLSSPLDQEKLMLPQRQVLRDQCTHRYRIYIEGAFDYSKATCPYTADNYFTKIGEATANPGQDECGRKLSDCKLRFGNDPLPTRAFPGVSRVRV